VPSHPRFGSIGVNSMKLPEILDKLKVPRRTLYNWMERHPNLPEKDTKSLLGHPFPKPTNKVGRDNIWDDAAVMSWWDANAKTVGRHPEESPTFVMEWDQLRDAMQRPPKRWTTEQKGETIHHVDDDMAMVQRYERLNANEVRLHFRDSTEAVLFRLKY
jgi:predicted DNA-binding transcriptional regulator AlpA